MRKNFVLIDYENLQPKTFERLAHESFHVKVFVGPNQPKVPVETAMAMQSFGERAEYIRISKSRKNAADFHIAYYVGMLTQQSSQDRFYIVSRDDGFDPLVEHLKSKKIEIRRVTAIGEVPAVKRSDVITGRSRAEIYAQKLAEPKMTKPRTLTTLGRHIGSFFTKQRLTEREISRIVAELIKQRIFAVDGKNVVYLNGSV